MSQKGFAPILTLVGLLVIITIIGGAYLLNKAYYQSETWPQFGEQEVEIGEDELNDLKNTISENPPLEQPSPSPLPKDILEKIKVEPNNAVNLKKTYVYEDNCSNPVGLVTYEYKPLTWMKINSTSLKHNADITKGVNDLLKFLDAGKQSDFQNLDSLEAVFRDYCGGNYNQLMQELDGIKYPNVDRARVLMLRTGQSYWGNVHVTVYAQKGDNIIQLSKYLSHDEPKYNALYKQYEQSCKQFEDKEDWDGVEQCNRKQMISDKQMEQFARIEANNLINMFAIK